MKYLIPITLLWFSWSYVHGQVLSLEELRASHAEFNSERLERVEEYSRANNLPIIFEGENNVTYCIFDVVDGKPVLYRTDNSGAATTTGADQIGICLLYTSPSPRDA